MRFATCLIVILFFYCNATDGQHLSLTINDDDDDYVVTNKLDKDLSPFRLPRLISI